MDNTKEILLVCKKEITDKSGTHSIYYGYRQEEINGEFVDIKTHRIVNNELQLKALSIKVKLSTELEKRIEKQELTFPIRMELSTEHKLPDGSDSCFVTVDKDANKNVRLDKYGKRHLVCIIREPVSMTPVEPKKYSLSDLDDFE